MTTQTTTWIAAVLEALRARKAQRDAQRDAARRAAHVVPHVVVGTPVEDLHRAIERQIATLEGHVNALRAIAADNDRALGRSVVRPLYADDHEALASLQTRATARVVR